MAKKKKKSDDNDGFLSNRELAILNANRANDRGRRCSECKEYKICQDRKKLLRGLEHVNCTNW